MEATVGRKARFNILTGLIAALALFGGMTMAQSSSDYYKGKTVTLILPNSPSGQMTQYARMIAPYIAKHLGAADVRVKNMQGAGGVVGANYLWHAKPDGMTIAFTSVPALVLAQLSGSKGVEFDATKFIYLGRAATEARVLVVGGKSKIQSIQDVQNLGRPFIFPTQGTDEDFYTMAVLAKALNFELKAVTGYQGNADTTLAVIKGEGDGHITAWHSSLAGIQAGDLRPILTIGDAREAGYPNVPTAVEVTQGQDKTLVQAIVNMITMHRSFFGPPGMPEAAVSSMRSAVWAALHDPGLLADAKKQGLIIVPMQGAEEQPKVEQIAAAGQSIVPVLKQAVAAIQ
jgi:tripartite-type tricarboxylate transporter receptor subunit TctC